MTFFERLGVAWEGLTTNKIRSLLTMLGVIIGVASVIIMMSISAGTEATIAEQINSLGANLIFVSTAMTRGGPGSFGSMPTGVTYEDALAIARRVPSAAGVSVEQRANETVKYGGESLTDVELLAVTPDFPSVREVEVADGRFISDKELDNEAKVAVLGAGLAEELFGEADPIGEGVIVGTTKLTVIGVMKEKGSVGGEDWDNRLYMPVTLVFTKFSGRRFAPITGNMVRTIYVQAESQDAIEDTITQVSLLLAKRHEVSLDEPDFNVQTQQDIIDTQESTTAAFRSLLSWVAGVSLVVGGIGIMNIMLVSVTERTREIGIRQAVGATQHDIRSQFLSEALMLSLVGGLLGVLSGVVGSWVFGIAGDMRTVIVPSSIVLAFLSAAAVGIFFGYYPANQAAKLDPIESLRHE